MVIERAKILRENESTAIVTIETKEACRRCFSKNVCVVSAGNLRQMEVENSIGAKGGDLVEIEIQQQDVIKKTSLVYILPSLFWVGGIIFSLLAGLNELMAFAVGILCLAAAFFLLSVIDKRYAREKQFQPKIIKIL